MRLFAISSKGLSRNGVDLGFHCAALGSTPGGRPPAVESTSVQFPMEYIRA
jgi:hypothetical protein